MSNYSINSYSDPKADSTDDFVEAAELLASHRRPVVWMLAIQVAVLGAISIRLTSPTLAAVGTMVALLAGFLWYANSVWLLAFAFLVIGVQAVTVGGGEIALVQDNYLLNCGLILLMLVASFRYIELRRYSRTFDTRKPYRELEVPNKRRLSTGIWVVLTQIVRRHWYNSVFAILGAFLLLRNFPESQALIKQYWLQPSAGRFIFLSLLLFFGWFIFRTMISIWDWFRLTPEQADVAIRSLANREFWSETAGVQKRKNKLKIKDAD